MSLAINTLLFILAAILGVSATVGVFEMPGILRGTFESENHFDLVLLFLGCGSALLGIFQFLFMRSRRRNAWLSFSVLGAILIYSEIFNVAPIKFGACEFLLAASIIVLCIMIAMEHPLHQKNGAKVSSIDCLTA